MMATVAGTEGVGHRLTAGPTARARRNWRPRWQIPRGPLALRLNDRAGHLTSWRVVETRNVACVAANVSIPRASRGHAWSVNFVIA